MLAIHLDVLPYLLFGESGIYFSYFLFFFAISTKVMLLKLRDALTLDFENGFHYLSLKLAEEILVQIEGPTEDCYYGHSAINFRVFCFIQFLFQS